MAGKLVVLGLRKLVFTAAMLLGIIVPLLAVSYNMPVENVATSVYQMLTYESQNGGLKFDYPQGWFLRVEKDYSGREILENVNFWNSDNSAYGFVQVMRISKSVPEYIQDAKKSMSQGYDSLVFEETSLGGKKGYLLSYKRGQGEARRICAEYFFPRGGKVYRFSCFYPEKMSDYYAEVFTDMLNSFRF